MKKVKEGKWYMKSSKTSGYIEKITAVTVQEAELFTKKCYKKSWKCSKDSRQLSVSCLAYNNPGINEGRRPVQE